ncbi:hypothetical protein J2S04_002854 [Alicyclobacillus tengchongensis]|uniref:HTH araC/xylS-type domain-containing protein n=1 Tax=Alicyclobacillus tolerans TaxID=90970 RepID=A0ABT9M035_9BACL|nr:hypothetical protein [Alicyclobacillus tengchongensis]
MRHLPRRERSTSLLPLDENEVGSKAERQNRSQNMTTFYNCFDKLNVAPVCLGRWLLSNPMVFTVSKTLFTVFNKTVNRLNGKSNFLP